MDPACLVLFLISRADAPGNLLLGDDSAKR